MRAVIQRVTKARVTVDDAVVGNIKAGLVVLLGVEKNDSEIDLEYLYKKIVNLRIFDDKDGKMNLAIKDIGGEILVVSQFTLYGDCRKGRRPSFDTAASLELARMMYEGFIKLARKDQLSVQTGIFQAQMFVELVNDGPVTILLDSKKTF